MMYLNILEASNQVDMEVARGVARGVARRVNTYDRIERNAFHLSDRKFIKRYRLSKNETKALIQEISPHMIRTSRSDALDVETKVLAALNFYAFGAYQTEVGDGRHHCIAQSSVSKAIKEVTMVLNMPEIINKYVSFPFTVAERQQIKREFYNQFKLPGCLACVDGTHVAIVRPHEHEERYFNRKNYHSLNVQIICDSKLNILNVDPSYPGSTHDSLIWANSPINNYINRLHTVNGEDIYLLGDSGYPLRPILMTPITDPQAGSPEALYQNLHLTARNTVERCIGVLKGRFRCLLGDRKLHYSPVMAAKITNACCVLHNIANRHNFSFQPLTEAEVVADHERQEGANIRIPTTVHSSFDLQMGRARRSALIQRIWTNRVLEI